MENDLNIDELVEQLTGEALAGKMVLLLGDDPDAIFDRLRLVTEALIDFGVELVRFDALQLHDVESLRGDLCAALGVEAEHLLVGLRIRGQTGNPLLLVVDNSECLAADARRLIARIASEAQGSLGVVFGGEADAEEALLSSSIPLALVMETHSEPATPAESAPVPAAPGKVAVPWRHLAAVLGLSLLAWLFWPADDSTPDSTTSEVTALTLPARPANVADADSQADTTGDDVQLSEEATAGDAGSTSANEASAPATASTASTASAPATASASSAAPSGATEPSAEMAPSREREPSAERKPPAASIPPLATEAAERKVAPEPATPSGTSEQAASKPSRPALSGLAAELGYRHEDWLLAQQGSQWVLQVATAVSEDAARMLLDQLGRERAAYYRARRDGRTLFIVLATGWQSREQALAGRDKLAAGIRQRGPFPREMRTIHSEIIASR